MKKLLTKIWKALEAFCARMLRTVNNLYSHIRSSVSQRSRLRHHITTSTCSTSSWPERQRYRKLFQDEASWMSDSRRRVGDSVQWNHTTTGHVWWMYSKINSKLPKSQFDRASMGNGTPRPRFKRTQGRRTRTVVNYSGSLTQLNTEKFTTKQCYMIKQRSHVQCGDCNCLWEVIRGKKMRGYTWRSVCPPARPTDSSSAQKTASVTGKKL